MLLSRGKQWMTTSTRRLTNYCSAASRQARTTRMSRRNRAILDREQSVSHDSSNVMEKLRQEYRREIVALPEYTAQVNLEKFLSSKAAATLMSGSAMDSTTTTSHMMMIAPPMPPPNGYRHILTPSQVRLTLDAAMATFCLHVEARIAALVGQGFYTIGPCGEELLASVGHALDNDQNDTVALHYRHLAINILRQLLLLKESHDDDSDYSLKQILLDRARGYTVSRHDPVTGGVHCAIGSAASSHTGDYVVTSTLASQCPSAVGRALGFALANQQREEPEQQLRRRPISVATIGDGSVHNHHFWASYHLARHARHRSIKCPVVFGISDNGLSISYETRGYVNTLFGDDSLVPVFTAYGGDMMDVYDQTLQATQYARQQSAPAVVLYHGIVRRFGHAASDRQHAYLSNEDIQSMADTDVLASAIVQAVEVLSVTTYAEMRDRFLEIQSMTQSAFEQAAQEDKVTRQDMLERVSQPMFPVPRLPQDMLLYKNDGVPQGSGTKREVMRKHMTRVLAEVMEDNPSVVYIGEDVEHGGYYMVTDGLADLFPGRVHDFPPDETTLLGAAMGFSQVGLVPIVEIPYAKYLDCGVDKYYELSLMNWLTAGQTPSGMVIRLQGFDRGMFGGNFHTHNMLSHVPPGVDMVSYSNGEDYVRGFRNAIAQAKAGRVVVLVDCTHLLNLRHLYGKDRGWERTYPTKDSNAMMSFHDVRRYGNQGRWAIVSYGNGVVTSLQARRSLLEKGVIKSETELDVIDCPYISAVPDGLKEVVADYEGIVFADICKEGPGSNVFSSMITNLHGQGLLPTAWEFVGAPRTYNPLGSTVTFLNVPDVEDAFVRLTKK